VKGCWQHSLASWQVTLISRQPTPARRLVRLINNEDEVAAMLRALPGVDAQMVDLASLTLQQQLELIAHTDILVGEQPSN